MNAQVEEIISELNYALALPFVTIEQKSIVRDEIKRIHKKAFASLKQPAPPCQECENLKHDLEGYMEANKALINREWVKLSDAEILILCAKMAAKLPNKEIDLIFARAIEQASKEKNT